MDKSKQMEIVLHCFVVIFFLILGIVVIPLIITHSSPEITNVELLAEIKVLFYQILAFEVSLNALVREVVSPLIKALANRLSEKN